MFARDYLGTVDTMKSLSRDEIMRLTAPERLALIGELWDSLDDGDIALPAPQSDELKRRLDSFDGDLQSAVTWEQLRAELADRTN